MLALKSVVAALAFDAERLRRVVLVDDRAARAALAADERAGVERHVDRRAT